MMIELVIYFNLCYLCSFIYQHHFPSEPLFILNLRFVYKQFYNCAGHWHVVHQIGSPSLNTFSKLSDKYLVIRLMNEILKILTWQQIEFIVLKILSGQKHIPYIKLLKIY